MTKEEHDFELQRALELFAARIWDVKYEGDKMFLTICRETGCQSPDQLLRKYIDELHTAPILTKRRGDDGASKSLAHHQPWCR